MTTSVLDDKANQCFLDLIVEDEAEPIGEVLVDSGTIELGDCGKVYVEAQTNYGDGVYTVWRGKKYLIIEMDMFNTMKLDEALNQDE
jgi:hypothetical protein